MADSRITQAATLALGEYEAESQITQAATLVLFQPTAQSQITNNVNLVLAEYEAENQITQAATLVLAVSAPCITREVQCWRIERTDGVVYGFTTHDQDVTYRGVTYKACDGISTSATSQSVFGGASSGDIEARGILSQIVTDFDLYRGLYDGAIVVVELVDWQTLEGRTLTRGLVSKTQQGLTSYNMTAITAGARLQQQPLLEVYSPLCRYQLGDARCTVDLSGLTVSSTVEAVSAPNVVTLAKRRQFVDASLTESSPGLNYANGNITWTSGNNSGVVSEVKSVIDGVVTLWYPLPFDIEVGDGFDIVPGCDKTETTCRDEYDNIINFGGFPDVPGTDFLNKPPG